MRPSEQFIEALVYMNYGLRGCEPDKSAFRAALRSLVRLARAEQRQDIEEDLARIEEIARKNSRIG